MTHFLSNNTNGPLGTKSRFAFITNATKDQEALRWLITYGLKNPMGFIIGAVENAQHSLEDFGYLMEKNILMATDLGLGTCWLGGTFNSSRFSRKIALLDNEILPAVTPVGYAVQKLPRWTPRFALFPGRLSVNPGARYSSRVTGLS